MTRFTAPSSRPCGCRTSRRAPCRCGRETPGTARAPGTGPCPAGPPARLHRRRWCSKPAAAGCRPGCPGCERPGD